MERLEKQQFKANMLNKYGTDLTKMAQEGKLDQVGGRQKQIERVTQILCRRRKDNPCLVGDPGVGKTVIVEGLAANIVEGTVPSKLEGKKVHWSIRGAILQWSLRVDFSHQSVQLRTNHFISYMRCMAVHGGGKINFKGLYSGLAGNLAGVLPASAIFVGVYEPTKQKLLKSLPENLSALAQLTAGAIGGAASSLVRVPTEVVKQRMQTGQFASAPDAIRLIVSEEGFKGLYAGYGSFLLRDLPFDAIQFCIYEQMLMGYKLAAKRDPKDAEIAIVGAFAGAITGAMTTPLDVVKTRLMVQGSANQYKGIFDCARTIAKEEGTRALLKGLGPRVLWIGVGGAIFFGVLEKTKQILAQRCPQPKIRSIDICDDSYVATKALQVHERQKDIFQSVNSSSSRWLPLLVTSGSRIKSRVMAASSSEIRVVFGLYPCILAITTETVAPLILEFQAGMGQQS
ncbi:hypothetical protein D5086_011238 [Populus alba]|uniref:Uncharacterized protein n=1 Tax=Populus alba TaxID=43335 RepID=A0ACC4CBN6_POPAL